MPELALYRAMKAALTLLTKSWTAVFAQRGVNVNTIAPRPTMMPANAAMGDSLIRQLTKTLPAGRAGQASDIAEATLYPS